jgi:hypothetical protein
MKRSRKWLANTLGAPGKVELPENVLDFLFCLERDLLEFVEDD